MIKLVERKHATNGFRFDAKRGVHVGWLLDVTIRGRRLRRTFPTRAEAERFAAQLVITERYRSTGLDYDRKEVPRLSEVFAARLKAIAGRTEAGNARTVFKRFSLTVGHDPRITDLRRADFQNYINARLADGLMASTVNREITMLAAAVRAAPEMFPHELERFEPPAIPRPRNVARRTRTRVITPDEKDRLLHAILTGRTRNEKRERRLARPIVAAMFELAWLLGLRLGEVRQLTRADFDGTALRVIRRKTGSVTRFEDLPERAASILAEYAPKADPLIFDLPCSLATLYSILRGACADCGLEYGRASIDGITFHATRHSFTTRLVEVTDIATAASLTGHADRRMVAYYSHASPASRRAAMEKLYGGGRRADLVAVLERVAAGELTPEEAADLLA